MYEKPKLVPVGEVENVVRGYSPVGTDVDTTFTVSEQEFAEEEDDETESAGA